MSAKETEIVNQIMVSVSKQGGRCWKNVRGLFYTLDCTRKVAAGLQAEGSSDLIGFVPVVITQEHLGKTLPIFTAIECKTATGVVSPKQRNFIDFIKKSGGLSGVARSVEDAAAIIGG